MCNKHKKQIVGHSTKIFSDIFRSNSEATAIFAPKPHRWRYLFTRGSKTAKYSL